MGLSSHSTVNMDPKRTYYRASVRRHRPKAHSKSRQWSTGNSNSNTFWRKGKVWPPLHHIFSEIQTVTQELDGALDLVSDLLPITFSSGADNERLSEGSCKEANHTQMESEPDYAPSQLTAELRDLQPRTPSSESSGGSRYRTYDIMLHKLREQADIVYGVLEQMCLKQYPDAKCFTESPAAENDKLQLLAELKEAMLEAGKSSQELEYSMDKESEMTQLLNFD